MYHEQAVMDLIRTRILYGVQVMINASKMADKVFAAFRSAFFSCNFFFFLFVVLFAAGLLPNAFGMFFVFKGILISGM